MKSIALIWYGLLVIVDGRTIESLYTPRVINGEEAKFGERPYQVSLQERGSHFCGGSIVNEHWIVTAAHCLPGRTASSIEIVAGTLDLKEPYSSSQAQQIIVHENYSLGDSFRNDIALIKVATPFKFGYQVQPVVLPELHSKVKINSTAVLSGWGQLIDWSSPDKLQKVSIYVADSTYCSYVMKEKNMNIYPTHLCAIDPSMRKGQCYGDSGGPLTVDGKLTGIVSWSIKEPDCASTRYPGVYTRTSEFVDWIHQHTK